MKDFRLRLVAASSVSVASLLCVALPAQAFEFKISGQVDRAMIAADNGEDSDVGFVDNVGSNTRFRFTGDQALDNGMTLGFAYEIGLGENESTSFDVNNGGGDNGDFLDNRLANVYLEGNFGRLTFGKLDGAGNGSSELNYSGNMYLGGGNGAGFYHGGISFLDDDGNAIINLSGALNSFDSLSRQNAVRYDTPSLGGAVLSASLDNGHAYELSGRYEGDFADGGKFGLVGVYVDSQSQSRDIEPDGTVLNDGARFQETGGSGSVLLPSGLNFTGSYKHRNFKNGDPSADNYFGSVGYILGKNHFELSYARTNDLFSEGSKAAAYGLSYVYNWIPSVELYASYHLYTLDDADYEFTNDAGTDVQATGDAQDINALFLGTRLKFL
ncbi:porin [Salinisphaera aquimarina]|uniref:Porin n=1 Tax=Salinisphaera aquimarina TaxID=2094031 RepID=A0ABV7EUG5_9GAMM